MMLNVSEMDSYNNWNFESFLIINDNSNVSVNNVGSGFLGSTYHEIGHSLQTSTILSNLGILNDIEPTIFEASNFVVNY